MGSLSISKGNIKLGSIQSISLPAGTTCRACKCQEKCYAKKIERLRPAVRAAYKRNLDLLNEDPDTYWREAEAAVMMSRFFRFHVSGDIPDDEYFENMVAIASRNEHCQILCFTKKYEIINNYIRKNGELPANLKIIFSAWIDLKMVNPFLMPEAHVRYKGGFTTANTEAQECGGNCTDCARTDEGCWALKKGGQIVFNEH